MNKITKNIASMTAFLLITFFSYLISAIVFGKIGSFAMIIDDPIMAAHYAVYFITNMIILYLFYLFGGKVVYFWRSKKGFSYLSAWLFLIISIIFRFTYVVEVGPEIHMLKEVMVRACMKGGDSDNVKQKCLSSYERFVEFYIPCMSDSRNYTACMREAFDKATEKYVINNSIEHNEEIVHRYLEN